MSIRTEFPQSKIQNTKLKIGLAHLLLAALPISAFWAAPATLAQSIAPAPDGTNTVVTPTPLNGGGFATPNRYDISGGQTSADGANLFHSFEQFGLGAGEIANFISNPNISNILGRVVGGDASIINGLLQVSGGNSNLFLINPSGIVFGSNASLNIPGDFLATTATGIGFDRGWFKALAPNDYAALVGQPSIFEFGNAAPGSIINAAQLSVNPGKNIVLLGGTAISTGSLNAPNGKIAIAAIRGQNRVRISQPGHLLSLEITLIANNSSLVSPASLPQLLTDPDIGHATGLSINSAGEAILTGSGLRVESGDIAIAPSQRQNILHPTLYTLHPTPYTPIPSIAPRLLYGLPAI